MSDWAKEYIEEAERIWEAEKVRFKKKHIKELKSVSKQLRKKMGKYSKEAEYIEKKIIPYVEKMAYYPPSYRGMVEIFKELLI